MARTPHGYHEVEQIREDLIAAGFTSFSVDAVDNVSRASSLRDPAVAYCQGTPLRNEIEARNPRVSKMPLSVQRRRWHIDLGAALWRAESEHL
jgi:hypothetical protein